MHLNGLYKAIKYFGSQQALASTVGVTQQTVSLWLNRDEKIPTLFAFKIFAAVKGLIPLDELSSDATSICQLFDSVRFFQKFPQILLPIDEINVSEMNCPIYLNQEFLVFDLNNEMLLRPILVDSSRRVITCSCRIHANRMLKNKSIFVHKINLPDVIAGRISIAALIQTLPVSEQVAVGKAIERELGNRQGKRTDLLPHKSAEVSKSNGSERFKFLQDNLEARHGSETRVVAARIAGFSSHFLYGEAKEVTEKGISSLIQAMDNQKLSISKAKKIAQLPQDEQRQIVLDISKKRTFKKVYTGETHE